MATCDECGRASIVKSSEQASVFQRHLPMQMCNANRCSAHFCHITPNLEALDGFVVEGKLDNLCFFRHVYKYHRDEWRQMLYMRLEKIRSLCTLMEGRWETLNDLLTTKLKYERAYFELVTME